MPTNPVGEFQLPILSTSQAENKGPEVEVASNLTVATTGDLRLGAVAIKSAVISSKLKKGSTPTDAPFIPLIRKYSGPNRDKES